MVTRLFPRLKGLSRQMFSTTTALSADHLVTTQASTRKEMISPATVMEVKDLSETVKMLTLQINNKDFSFKAGQWVDTFIPGVETVGGYSIASSPAQLKAQGLMVLAIKFAKHPPAFWIHTKCKKGDTLLLRVGGDFFFEPDAGEERSGDVLLVAGGVGINPLYSMMSQVAHLNTTPGGPYTGKLTLLFSARTCSELIFKDEIEVLSASNSNISSLFFASRESAVPASVKVGRITHADIQRAIEDLTRDKLKVFMCGPAPMIQDMEQHCLSCHLTKQQLFYENWW